MLTRKRQVVAKIEATEGTAETLAIADAKTLGINPKITHDVKMFERNPVRATIGQLAQIPGQRPGKYIFSLELRGSGTAITPPDWGKFFKACGSKENTVKSINIGAVTNGPFVHGETVTGGTSLATGRVILNTANGASFIYVVVLTGTFQSAEVITGSTSTATATTSSTATSVGVAYEPDTNPPSLTMANYEDGLAKTLKGCRGNFKINFKSGEVPIVDFEFSGVEAGVVNASLFTNPAYESTKPPAFLNAALTHDTVALKVSDITVDAGVSLGSIDDVNSDRGLFSFIIGSRKANGAFTARMELTGVHDFFSKWFTGALMILDFNWGTTAGNKFRFQAAKVQYTKNDDVDQGGLAAVKSSFAITESVVPGDDGWVLLCL